MEKFLVPINLLQLVLNYLSHKPYNEVQGLIEALQRLEKAPVTPPDLKAVEKEKPVS